MVGAGEGRGVAASRAGETGAYKNRGWRGYDDFLGLSDDGDDDDDGGVDEA